MVFWLVPSRLSSLVLASSYVSRFVHLFLILAMAQGAKHWLMPASFSGTGQDFELFIMDYETAIEANGFPLDDPSSASEDSLKMALLVLKRSLSGSAASMLRSLPESERKSSASVLAALKKRFGSEGKETISQAELRSRRRLPHESLEELGDAIQILAERSYPGINQGVFATITVRRIFRGTTA